MSAKPAPPHEGEGGSGLQDAAVLLVALGAVLFSFSDTGAVTLKPSWAHSIDANAGFGGLPPPVVADFDEDGEIEVLVASSDGHLRLLSSRNASARASMRPSSKWLPLHAKRTVSLRSHVGLSTGSLPVAIAAGAIDEHPVDGKRRQIVVALTEDWTLSAFDHTLQPLWQHSIGRPSMATASRDTAVGRAGGGQERLLFHEVSLLVSSHQIYMGDRGAVLLAGRTEPKHSLQASQAVGPICGVRVAVGLLVRAQLWPNWRWPHLR